MNNLVNSSTCHLKWQLETAGVQPWEDVIYFLCGGQLTSISKNDPGISTTWIPGQNVKFKRQRFSSAPAQGSPPKPSFSDLGLSSPIHSLQEVTVLMPEPPKDIRTIIVPRCHISRDPYTHTLQHQCCLHQAMPTESALELSPSENWTRQPSVYSLLFWKVLLLAS